MVETRRQQISVNTWSPKGDPDMAEVNVVPMLDTLKSLGVNLKDWLLKAGKSKTIWFSIALIVFGAIQTIMPSIEALVGHHFSGITMVIGVITGLLRFATTGAVSAK
jgi:hypothetical protein